MSSPPSVAGIPPPQEALNAFLAPGTQILRYVQIVRPDGSEYASVDSSGVASGYVSVDYSRTERRAFELVLENIDGRFQHRPGQLWYDKIIRIWRGVRYVNTSGVITDWTTQIGEFAIDAISSQNFPHTIHLQGRDMTKKLMTSKFKVPTSFASGQAIEAVIQAVAIAGGITKLLLPVTDRTTGKDWYFDSGITRWEAISQIATNYGYEVFFDGTGYLVMQLFQDPVTSPVQVIFNTGIGGEIVNTGYSFVATGPGNLVTYKKTSKDARLYNSIVVTAESTNITPVTAFASNTVAGSATSIAEIGERVYRYASAFLTTYAQCLEVARNLLATRALEEYELDLGSIVFPWLDAGNIAYFADPDPDTGEPSRFLMSNFTIPLQLGPMSTLCKRVTLVLEDDYIAPSQSILRPNGVYLQGDEGAGDPGAWYAAPTGTLHGVTSDDSDSTTAYAQSGSNELESPTIGPMALDLTTVDLTGKTILSVIVSIRVRITTFGALQTFLQIGDTKSASGTEHTHTSGAFSTLSGQTYTTKPGGGAWAPSDIATLRVRIEPQLIFDGGDSIELAEVYVTVNWTD